jgi:hypothetical protein
MAAVLACGKRAVLSHRSAGALWAIRRFAGRPEVTWPGARLVVEIDRFAAHGTAAPSRPTAPATARSRSTAGASCASRLAR